MPSFKLLSKLLIMDPKTRITSAKAMEDEYFQDKVDGLPQGNHFEINICKVGCVLNMGVLSLLLQAKFGLHDLYFRGCFWRR